MNKKFLLRIATALSFVVMLVINAMAGSTTIIGGQNTAAVSATYPTLFTPAGYTFAIWGVIYLLLAGYVAFQLGWFGKLKKDKQKAVDTIAPYAIALSLVNSVWIFAWQYEVMWLSVLLITTMLVLLIKIVDVLRKLDYTKREYALLRAPFGVYFGWITVATVANISVWLVSIHWDGWGIDPNFWLVYVLWIAAAIGTITMIRNRDWVYGVVFVWAYVGILLSNNAFDINAFTNLAVLTALLAAISGLTYLRAKAKLK